MFLKAESLRVKLRSVIIVNRGSVCPREESSTLIFSIEALVEIRNAWVERNENWLFYKGIFLNSLRR